MRKNLENCVDKLKVYYGISPYNSPSNIAYHDRYYYKSVRDAYDSDTLVKAEKEIERMQKNGVE